MDQYPGKLLDQARMLAAGLAVAAVALTGCSEGEYLASKETTTTTIAIEPTTTAPEMTDTAAERFADELNSRFQGFNPGEIVAGNDVVFEGTPQERGAQAFSDHTLTTKEEVAEFLASDNERAKVVRGHVEHALADDPEELKRALNGEGYVAIQANVPIIINGTTYFVDGNLAKSLHSRSAGAGDVFWVFAKDDGSIVWPATLRADCVNPDLDEVTPVRPGMPVPPSIELGPKADENYTPAGVPGQNRGSGTEDSGPRGPGKGPIGQTTTPQGSLGNGSEKVVPAVPEKPTHSDPNSSTIVPTPPAGTEQNPDLGGNGTPAAPPTSVDTTGGQGGSTGGTENI